MIEGDMSGRKGKQKGESSKARKSSKSSKSSKAKESGSSSSEPETSSDTLADVKDGASNVPYGMGASNIPYNMGSFSGSADAPSGMGPMRESANAPSDMAQENAATEQLRQINRVVRRTKPDGHCMFEAAAMQLPDMDKLKVLEATIAHGQKEADSYKQFYSGSPSCHYESYEKMLEGMRYAQGWDSNLGDIMPRMIAGAFNRHLVVISSVPGVPQHHFPNEQPITADTIVTVHNRNQDHHDAAVPQGQVPDTTRDADTAPVPMPPTQRTPAPQTQTGPAPQRPGGLPESEQQRMEDIMNFFDDDATTGTGSGIGNKKKKKTEGQSNPSESETTNDSSSKEENRLDQPRRLLTVGGLNVDSLLAKGKEQKVKALIAEHDLDILVVGESKLSNRKALADLDKLKIDNFTYVRQDRTFMTKASGGLLIYIKNNIKFTVDSFWEWPESNVQFVEISITTPRRFDLVAIYSPNKKHRQYVINLMRFFLERNKELQIPVMFVGDLNIDPNRNVDKKAKDQLEQIHKTYNTKCLITQVTHVPAPRKRGKKKMQPQSSCIDHIITDIPVNDEDVHVEGADGISRHKLVFCTIANEERNVAEQVKSISLLREPVNAQCLSKWLHKLVRKRDIKYHLTVRHGADYHVTEPITNENVRPLTEFLNINNSTALKCESFAIEHKTRLSLDKSLEPLTHKVNGVDCFLLKCSSQNAQFDLSTIKHFMSEYFVCDGKLFSTDSWVKTYQQDKFHICPYCEGDQTQIKSAKKLNKHITKKHPHRCHVKDCFKAFRTQQLVQNPVRNSHLQCCSETFKSKQKLDSHVEKDHQVNNFKCRFKSCCKVFNNQKDRCEHEKLKHSPCTYDTCPKVYKKERYLRKHSETHSIYWCGDLTCDQWFDNTVNRYAHENDGNHSVCESCPEGERRAYTGKVGLQTHIRQKHNQ